jgi:hypothetical protein
MLARVPACFMLARVWTIDIERRKIDCLIKLLICLWCGQGIFPGVGVLDACKSAGVHSLPPFLSLTGEEGVCMEY